MEEPKYYQPEIEEFHVGFEYEHFCDISTSGDWGSRCQWVKKIVRDYGQARVEWEKSTDVDFIYPSIPTTGRYYNNGLPKENWTLKDKIRVKSLDREDIESFGFKLWTYKGNELGFMLNHEGKEGSTWIHRIEGKIKISTTFPDITLYLGKIKNKSELKRVLQQLEII